MSTEMIQSNQIPWGYDYCRVRSNQNVSFSSFNGDIEFNLPASESERWISGKNSFLAIKLRILQTDEAGNVGTLQPIINTATTVTNPTLSKSTATLRIILKDGEVKKG